MTQQKYAARLLLDRLRAQLELRLPVPFSNYGSQTVKVGRQELLSLAVAVRDYMAAEREWSAIPDPLPPKDE